MCLKHLSPLKSRVWVGWTIKFPLSSMTTRLPTVPLCCCCVPLTRCELPTQSTYDMEFSRSAGFKRLWRVWWRLRESFSFNKSSGGIAFINKRKKMIKSLIFIHKLSICHVSHSLTILPMIKVDAGKFPLVSCLWQRKNVPKIYHDIENWLVLFVVGKGIFLI